MKSSNPLTALIPVPAPADYWRWGVVTSTNPVRVLLGGDTQASAATPDCLIPVQVGDKVRVHVSNRKMVIVGRQVKNHSSLPSAQGGEIVINGTAYPTSGVVASPGWTVARTDGNIYTGNMDIRVPFAPPAGWTFTWSVQDTTGFTFLSTSDSRPVAGVQRLRVLQVGSNSTTTLSRLAWQLVKL